MATSDPGTEAANPSSDEFHAALAEYLARIERDGSVALEEFKAKHPGFASRLGRQLGWLAEHMARRRDGLPERIGPYRVQQRLGAGGMGEVYLAEQTAPFRRPVAVKVIKIGRDTEARLQRFAAEIQTLASLNHNGIAKVFEAGADQGRPYFAMEYVPGKAITAYCAEERLELAARLRLFIDVCRAVEYAHRLGIIHRDLKPQNILVYGPPAEPVAKVIDFGLAKVVREDHKERRTHTGQLVGTPDYMSPEQVDESAARVVDTRADVYALGVVLYELLTGMLPLGLWQVRDWDVQELIRTIRERQPSSPSVRVEESASTDTSSPGACGTVSGRRLSRLLVGDLDSIVMKALAKDAAARYGGVGQLADDIQRYLRHQPVSSRRPTAGYVLRKFVRRHATAVAFTTVLTVGAVASAVTIHLLTLQSVQRLEHGNLFGLVRWVDELREQELEPPAARAEELPALRAWLREFELVLAQRDRMRAFVESGERAQGDASDPGGWASGRYAQDVLRRSLARTLEVLARMTRPGAELDKIRLRIDWAQRVEALTIDAHREAWERVRRELAEDDRFADLDLPPQVGLVPLGRDAGTGLQEFALLLPGGQLPQRRDGGWVIGPRTCPVFVLLPGGAVTIGSQHDDPAGPRYDAERHYNEVGLQEVAIEPFFASRYEFTNGQWDLLDPGDHGSTLPEVFYRPDHPLVDANLDWMEHVVLAWGMSLPTDHEWEYMARGGTDTPFWCGKDHASLRGKANLHDQSVRGSMVVKAEGEAVAWDDGFPGTAPVGSGPPNAYLLHDVHGNACEVADRLERDGSVRAELRGGSWHQGAIAARATDRTFWDGRTLPSVGFRPVIPVQR
ncbi:MAG: bifunctional serine/threonine-protein kinase/formylglycine-generating enzyme family protein [Planctomycetota bacterium]